MNIEYEFGFDTKNYRDDQALRKIFILSLSCIPNVSFARPFLQSLVRRRIGEENNRISQVYRISITK